MKTEPLMVLEIQSFQNARTVPLCGDSSALSGDNSALSGDGAALSGDGAALSGDGAATLTYTVEYLYIVKKEIEMHVNYIGKKFFISFGNNN